MLLRMLLYFMNQILCIHGYRLSTDGDETGRREFGVGEGGASTITLRSALG